MIPTAIRSRPLSAVRDHVSSWRSNDMRVILNRRTGEVWRALLGRRWWCVNNRWRRNSIGVSRRRCLWAIIRSDGRNSRPWLFWLLRRSCSVWKYRANSSRYAASSPCGISVLLSRGLCWWRKWLALWASCLRGCASAHKGALELVNWRGRPTATHFGGCLKRSHAVRGADFEMCVAGYCGGCGEALGVDVARGLDQWRGGRQVADMRRM